MAVLFLMPTVRTDTARLPKALAVYVHVHVHVYTYTALCPILLPPLSPITPSQQCSIQTGVIPMVSISYPQPFSLPSSITWSPNSLKLDSAFMCHWYILAY